MLIYILFILGFVLLIKGADILVKGASSIAKRFGLSDLIIGLTIVSFGTSMPELIVNIMASAEGSSALAVGNILGSNISNILLIVGISAIIFPLPVKKSTLLSEIPFSIVAILLVGFLANSELPYNLTEHELSMADGLILLLFFALFMAYIFRLSKVKEEGSETASTDEPKTYSMTKSVVFILAGCLALFLGGQWIVDGAVNIAEKFGLSQSLIGLTVVAVGTSLPELATSAVAAYRKNTDIAIGNVVGSNIFNLLWILGLSAVINPLSFSTSNNNDILVVVAGSCLLLVCAMLGKNQQIQRWHGVLFLLVYLAYVAYLVKLG